MDTRNGSRKNMMEHELKIWPEFFAPTISGKKTFEIRKDDRAFRAGDILWLREWDKTTGYTGRECKAVVTYILSGFGLRPDWVVMSIKNLNQFIWDLGKGTNIPVVKQEPIFKYF